MGYTSTGQTNSPATDEGRGLEADKLDADAVRFHMGQFIGKLSERYGEKNLNSFEIFETDSWESGIQNWTEGLDIQFKESTGQDLLTWLPLIAEGVLVEGYEESDRLMWDWRRFLADEITENYFQVVADFADKYDLIYVSEASGRQMYMYDPIGYQRISPVPMGEFWVSKARGQWVRVDNRVAASAAHLTGRKWVASESYTSDPESSRWTQHPFTLKAEGDKAFTEGVNKFVFHTYAHQPYPELKPGFTMARWGMHNHSGNTWWDKPVEAWFKYLARCQYMLQEGRFHGDILAYLGEEVPARLGGREEFNPQIPPGYNYDGCDFQALLDARVEDGEIVLPSGMRYKVLLLPDKTRMRLEVAERIAELAGEGALVVSPAIPTGSPSLSEQGEPDRKVKEVVAQYWMGTVAGKGSPEGKVIPAGNDLGKLLMEKGISPDFSYSSDETADVPFIHRIIGDYEVYFISNQEDYAVSINAVFRQKEGRFLTLWDPATGKKSLPREVNFPDPGNTGTVLDLDPCGSVFVVFSDHEVDAEPVPVHTREKEIGGPWTLQFPEGRGAPTGAMVLDDLRDWTKHEDFGVRHFSGTASYTTTLDIEEENLSGPVLLDLGEVREMAEVLVNGQAAEILWKPPFRTDITGLLKTGENKLEIRVTNLWANRLIGDAYYPEEDKWKNAAGTMTMAEWPEWLVSGDARPESRRIAWSTRKDYAKEDPLLPSGLLGPVALLFAEN